jgi:2-haloacid dehalogenase
MNIQHIVFDLGNVVIGWNPKALYAQAFPDSEKLDWFFANVCTDEWNARMDGGKSFDVSIAEKQKEFPEYAEQIAWWKTRWHEMITGEIAGTVAIINQLHAKGTSLFALSNWSAETFPYARKHFPSMAKFKDIVLSGEAKVIKPQREIYDLAVAKWKVDPATLLFIDDSAKNVAGAIAAGWNALHFTSPEAFAAELKSRGLL